MNKDIVEGKWKQMRGEAKAWWGKLTDDHLDRAAGSGGHDLRRDRSACRGRGVGEYGGDEGVTNSEFRIVNDN